MLLTSLDNTLRNQRGGLLVPMLSVLGEPSMKSIVLWLLGVPIVVIILLNLTGMLGH